MRVLARRLPFLVFAAVLAVASAAPVLADAEERKQNPYKGDADAILVGKGLFRYYCAGCHGMEGGGGFRGPDLTRGQLTHVADDHDMLGVVKDGIQGTQMPPQTLPDSNLWRMIAFITDLRSKARPEALTGDWESGRELFSGRGFCSGCHMVRGEGGRFGPDLTGIGKTRSWESFLEAIREPSAQFKNVLQADGRMAGGYESVRLVTPSGERITGVVRNEDTYTIQVLDQQENYHSYRKSELRELTHLDQSLMPVYSESALSDQDLKDLLLFLTRPAAE
jgi:putative heme-binding domain-containing protein